LRKNGATREVVDYTVNLSRQSDDDPPVVVDWHLNILLQILNDAAVQAQAPPLPAFLLLPIVVSIDESDLKLAILRSIRGIAPFPNLLPGNTFGFESTNAQVGNITAAAMFQCLSPWWAHQDNAAITAGLGSICPIAQLWIPRPRSNTMDRTGMSALPIPPGLTPLFN
jgi:hypothetical protein